MTATLQSSVARWLVFASVIGTAKGETIMGNNHPVLEGFATDKETNSRLTGATVVVDDKPTAITDARGFFRFPLMPGSYIIEARMLGYESVRKEVIVDSSDDFVQMFFTLTPQPIQLPGMTVNRERSQIEKLEEGVVQLQAAELAIIPKFVEPDPIRALQALPGVTSATSDFNAQVYLRGGNFDETMIFLDDVPVYNPYHFAGWLSTFNTDIIQEERVYLSNYPVTMGGFLSGAVNLYTKHPHDDRYAGSASLAPSTVRGYIEGPLAPGTFLVSARRTLLDAVVNPIAGKDGIPFFFYDLNAKYTLSLDETNSLTIGGFHSQDGFNVFGNSKSKAFTTIEDEPRWSNSAVSLDARHTFTQNIVASGLTYFSRSSLTANGQGSTIQSFANQTQVLRVANSITDYGAKLKLDFFSETSNYLIGVEMKRLRVKYEWDIIWNGYNDTEEILFPKPDSFYDYAERRFRYSASTSSIAGFGSATFHPADELTLVLGYRAEYVSSVQKVLHSPYLRGAYEISKDILLTVGYGRYYQYLYTIKESKTPDNFFSQFAVYFMANSLDQTANSDHFVVGTQLKDLLFPSTLDVELYYKARQKLPSSYNRPVQRYTFEKGTSIGADVLLKGQEGLLTYWLGYSLLRAVKDNGSFQYFANYDRTHSVKALLAFAPSENWRFDAFWTYGSGVPYTGVVGKFAGMESEFRTGGDDEFEWRPVEGRKNSARSENYQRLDLGVTGSFIWGELYVKPYVQVFNALNSANPYFFNFEETEQRASLIMPIVGLTVEF